MIKIRIEIWSKPTVRINADSICEGSEPFNFKDESSVNTSGPFGVAHFVDSRYWVFDGLNPIPPISINPWLFDPIESPTFSTSLADGTHQLSLSVTSNYGCINDTTVDVMYYKSPEISWTTTLASYPDSACITLGEEIKLNFKSTPLHYDSILITINDPINYDFIFHKLLKLSRVSLITII